MTLQVDMKAVPSELNAMLAAAKNGHEVLIVENNHPVAQLIAVQGGPAPIPRKRLKPGSWAGKIHIADDFDAPLEEFKEYM